MAWALSGALAVLAALLMAALTARWAQRWLTGARTLSIVWARVLEAGRLPSTPLLPFLVGYTGELAIIVWMRSYPLDRYLYPMIPAAAIILLRETASRERRAPDPCSSPRSRGSAHRRSSSRPTVRLRRGALAGGRGRRGARLRARDGRRRIRRVGFHAGMHVNATRPALGVAWYNDMFLTSPPCVRLERAARLHPGARRQRRHRQYLVVGPGQPLYLYGSTAAGCPAPPR